MSGTEIGRGKEEGNMGGSCGQTVYFIILSKINTNPSHQLINYTGSGYLFRMCQLRYYGGGVRVGVKIQSTVQFHLGGRIHTHN